MSTFTRSRLAASATNGIRLSSTSRQLAAIHLWPEVLRLSQRSRMKRSGLYAVRTQLLQPAAQLPGRASGEGHRQHRCRVVRAGGNAVCDAVGDRPGLAGARSRDDRNRPAQRRRDLSLLGVEIIQQRVGRDRRSRRG